MLVNPAAKGKTRSTCQHRCALALARGKCELCQLNQHTQQRTDQQLLCGTAGLAGRNSPAPSGPNCTQGCNRQCLNQEFGNQRDQAHFHARAGKPQPDLCTGQFAVPFIDIQQQIEWKQHDRRKQQRIENTELTRQGSAAVPETDHHDLEFASTSQRCQYPDGRADELRSHVVARYRARRKGGLRKLHRHRQDGAEQQADKARDQPLRNATVGGPHQHTGCQKANRQVEHAVCHPVGSALDAQFEHRRGAQPPPSNIPGQGIEVERKQAAVDHKCNPKETKQPHFRRVGWAEIGGA